MSDRLMSTIQVGENGKKKKFVVSVDAPDNSGTVLLVGRRDPKRWSNFPTQFYTDPEGKKSLLKRSPARGFQRETR